MTNNHLKISIITPSFNQGKYIEECILSVMNQNYPNLEHIIIDGGSTDSTLEIIKRYESNLTFWVSEKDTGQSQAINKGLKIANGEIVTWLNSDDLYLPNTLNKVNEIFQKNPAISLLHGNSILFGMNKKERRIEPSTNHLREKYLAYIPFPQPSSFFKKKILDKTGFLDEGLHYGMDYDLLVRIALNFEILQTNEVFSKYRIHSESKTKKGINFAKDWSIVFSKVLRSVPKSEHLIKALENINLYNSAIDKYAVTKLPENIKLSFLYFLNIQMHYYYEALELKKASQLASLIKDLNIDFYKSEKVKQISSKSNYLNPALITLLRNFTRK